MNQFHTSVFTQRIKQKKMCTDLCSLKCYFIAKVEKIHRDIIIKKIKHWNITWF